MGNLRITEFEKLCKSISPIEFVYDSKNQPGQRFNGMQVTSVFNKMTFMINPNMVCFIGDNTMLRLYNVEKIKDHVLVDGYEHVFTITCGNYFDSGTSVHKIIARKV